MKNLYLKFGKRLAFFKKKLVFIASMWLNSLKRDASFYNNHTELLAIWTILFLTLTGLFIVAINSEAPVIFLLFILAIGAMFAGSYVTIYYLYAIKHQNAKRLLPKLHKLLNKSFKLRNMFSSIKIPHF